MCGRYYVDDDTAKEIERVIRQVNEKIRRDNAIANIQFAAKDIHPTEFAPILMQDGKGLCCKTLRWGFPGSTSVIFNARSETALEKPSFREGIRSRRIVIPATHFYEWNSKKEKNIFRRADAPVLFMAGCYNRYENGDCFVILTTAANSSMKPVHDRMPLILEEEEITRWILNESSISELLKKKPCLLERQTDYEQMSLF